MIKMKIKIVLIALIFCQYVQGQAKVTIRGGSGSSGGGSGGGSFYVNLNYMSGTTGATVSAPDTLTLSSNFLDGFNAKIDTTLDNNIVISGATVNTNKTPITLTDGATVTWDAALGFNAKVTIAGNRTLEIINQQAGQYYKLTVIQDGSGTRTLAFPAGSLFPSGTTINLTSAASAKDILMAYYDGTNYYWTVGKDFK